MLHCYLCVLVGVTFINSPILAIIVSGAKYTVFVDAIGAGAYYYGYCSTVYVLTGSRLIWIQCVFLVSLPGNKNTMQDTCIETNRENQNRKIRKN